MKLRSESLFRRNSTTTDDDDDDDFEEEEGGIQTDRTWTFQEKKRVVEYYNESKGRTFKSIKRKWPRLSQSQFSRFKAQVASGGTKWDKLQEIDSAVMSAFIKARNQMKPVHDSDLAKWALKKAKNSGLEFSASGHWVYNFKKRNGLVSRKGTILQSDSASDDGASASV